MADSYEIGSIPPLSVWEGETVEFKVMRHTGDADFIMDVKPTPKGKISIDKAFGDFSYTPAHDDYEELSVSLQAERSARSFGGSNL